MPNPGSQTIDGLTFLLPRWTRRLLIRKVPGFNSAGHALTVTAYVVINVAICFTNIDLSSAGNFASRAGW